jgi:hypothetical protein
MTCFALESSPSFSNLRSHSSVIFECFFFAPSSIYLSTSLKANLENSTVKWLAIVILSNSSSSFTHITSRKKLSELVMFCLNFCSIRLQMSWPHCPAWFLNSLWTNVTFSKLSSLMIFEIAFLSSIVVVCFSNISMGFSQYKPASLKFICSLEAKEQKYPKKQVYIAKNPLKY